MRPDLMLWATVLVALLAGAARWRVRRRGPQARCASAGLPSPRPPRLLTRPYNYEEDGA